MPRCTRRGPCGARGRPASDLRPPGAGGARACGTGLGDPGGTDRRPGTGAPAGGWRDAGARLGGAGLGPANSDYVSSLGTDEFAKALIASASNSKLTPAAPGWAAVEASQVLEEFFGKIEGATDLAALAKEYDAKITPMLNGQ